MNKHLRHNLQKIILAVIVLLLAQMACQGNVNPNDPRVPASLNNMIIQFAAFFGQMQFIPIGIILPPQITQINVDSGSGTISIHGLGKTYLDIKGGTYTALTGNDLPQDQLVPVELQTKIRLFNMRSNGCEQEPEQNAFLAETTINADRTWSIEYNLKPGELIGARQVLEGKESGLSNLMINIDKGQILVVDRADELQQNQHEIFQDDSPIPLTGSSYPGACIVLQNQDMNFGRVGSGSTDAAGKWQIQAPLRVGENKFKVFVDGSEEINRELSIAAFSPVLQWPYPSNAPINAWYGKNDFHWMELKVFHDGLDIGGKENTPVDSVADGDVFYIQISNKNGGNVVLIDHGGWFSVYMHLSKIIINKTELTKSTFFETDKLIHVAAGQSIGETGHTGGNFGPHLHFSAFRWAKNDREKSLGKIKDPAWPFNFGIPYNLNPPKDTMLGNHENSTDLIQKCISDFDFWEVNWSLIPVTKNSVPSGTKFDNMGESEKCAIK